MARLGGRLVLRSSKGAGTSAEMWLPVAIATSDLACEQDTLSRPATEMPPLRILAVDDGALVLLNTAAMLEDLRAQRRAASAALNLLEEQPFDLVIPDHAMPR